MESASSLDSSVPPERDRDRRNVGEGVLSEGKQSGEVDLKNKEIREDNGGS
ncbi:hypothetical protein F2Q68_00010919 [Brassica cretica]|uniref:Uncharacterized protein n=1 Tax=Brassica cretica TaxID=69181 RepID=A0A8S9L124_BRACR|nr:hypothetical protein F2Q68_00010919 [Brassica cretica]